MAFSMFHLGFMVYRDIFVVRRVYRLKDEVEIERMDKGCGVELYSGTNDLQNEYDVITKTEHRRKPASNSCLGYIQ